MVDLCIYMDRVEVAAPRASEYLTRTGQGDYQIRTKLPEKSIVKVRTGLNGRSKQYLELNGQSYSPIHFFQRLRKKRRWLNESKFEKIIEAMVSEIESISPKS